MADRVSTMALRRFIFELLPKGHPSIVCAARQFGIPVRTLQRRLHDAGITYSELVDKVRYDAACRKLKVTHMNIADIANALGFSDPSNFSRAFQRWSGMSPSEYRRKHAARRARRRKD
jgi:AraC-like DNA-binding protein